ncbi:MAG: hypothetical protein ABSB19_20155 [Methylomonas sp.]|jgi:hypothetical protein
MEAQTRVLKQINIRINEYIHGDIELKEGDASHFMAQPNRVFSEGGYPEDLNNSRALLGYYVLMQKNVSPGKIVLVSNNLEVYFWHLFVEIKKFTPWINKNYDAMFALARWVVATTYWQLRFHHSLDMKRQMAGATADTANDRLTSEKELALAVAYSYKYMRRHYDTHAHSTLWEWFLKKAFRYTAPGYKDWFAYIDDDNFWRGVFDIAGLANQAALAGDEPGAPTLRNWLPGDDEFVASVNDAIGNIASEMGRLINIKDLLNETNELFLMWLSTFKWRAVDVLSFLISLPLNGFSIHIATAEGNLEEDWHRWKYEHTDWPDKPVIIDMPVGIERENFHFLLDGAQRFFILFLLFFIKAQKNGRAKDFFAGNGSAKFVLISLAENVFFQDLLRYLEQGGIQPETSTPEQNAILQAALVIQKWLETNHGQEDCYVFLIDHQPRECEWTPFKYMNKKTKTHKLINCTIY